MVTNKRGLYVTEIPLLKGLCMHDAEQLRNYLPTRSLFRISLNKKIFGLISKR